jgi:hypothetical protein
MIEHRMSGHIGHPAASIMDNNQGSRKSARHFKGPALFEQASSSGPSPGAIKRGVRLEIRLLHNVCG